MTAILAFKWVENPNSKDVSIKWKKLSEIVKPSLFISVDWIGSWVNTFNKVEWMLEVLSGDDLVAVGLFNTKYHRRAYGFGTRTLHLNMTGDERMDQIWPEYNGLLCLPEYKNKIYHSLLYEIFSFHKSVDEFDPGLVCNGELLLCDTKPYIVEPTVDTLAYQYELRNKKELPGFSKTLMVQLRRTRKQLDKIGEVSIEYELNRNIIINQFREMSVQHIKQWKESSGFLNTRFVAFHENVIKNSSQDLKPMIATLRIESNILARFLYYICDDTINYYLGTSLKHSDNRIKNGLYLHSEVIKNLQLWGCSQYDFLGGDFPYKKRMSTTSQRLVRVRIKRRLLKYRLEAVLKKFKNKFEDIFRYV